MKYLILHLAFLISIACTTSIDYIDKRNSDGVYQGSGIEQFLLPELPHWANFSEVGSCRKSYNVIYLNFDKLRKHYALSYKEAVHFQNMYNRSVEKFKKNNPSAKMNLKDEAFIFNNAYQLLIGGSHDFIMPKYNKISLIWIDPFLHNKKIIRKIFDDENVLKGHPIIISQCLSSYELELLVVRYKLDQFGTKYIGSEMFSPYDQNFNLNSSFSLDVASFFENKELTLFAPYRPNNLIGVKNTIIKK